MAKFIPEKFTEIVEPTRPERAAQLIYADALWNGAICVHCDGTACTVCYAREFQETQEFLEFMNSKGN